MTTETDDGVTVMKQGLYNVPDISMKELLAAIPKHCFKRSAVKSFSYLFWDIFVILSLYKTASYLDTFVHPATIALPHPLLYTLARCSIWALYGFGAGLFSTGLWIIAHECGHQAFSESKSLNDTVGWVLHSALGVPYHSWRITHAQHHASTGHMTHDHAFIPRTRSQRGLPPLDSDKEDLLGLRVSKEVKKELWDAVGHSPIGAAVWSVVYLLAGWPAYLLCNAAGQRKYPKGTNHFNPKAVFFAPHQRGQIIISDVGILIWLAVLGTWIHYKGFLEVFAVYLVPYLWTNHWIVLITFLQHTDPLLPHYRAPEFNFQRGALATLNRSLLGDCGPLMAWLGAHSTHGISETHILHHVCSKIPHYNAWEASEALKKKLESAGIPMDGAPVGWAEFYRVFQECRFVEDEGDVVFFKNAQGHAKMRPVFPDSESSASDSGVECK